MRRILALVILAAAIGGFMLLKATRPVAPQVEAKERVWLIETAMASPAKLQPTLTLYGRVEVPDRLHASAPVAGRVLTVLVRDGERVAAGAPLARMDPRDLQPRLQQARADVERERIRARHDRAGLEQERTLLQLAEAKLARFEKLKNARLGAESAFDQAREDVARARLAVSQREQAIAEHPARLAQQETRQREAERDVSRGELVAPFAARVGKVEVAAGDSVQAGQALLTLYPSDEIFLRTKVPAVYAAELQAALASGETLTATAIFGERELRARLERISGEADARGVDALLRLDDAKGVPVGAFVNAVLQRPAADGVFALPFAALHGGDRIYRIRDGRLEGLRVERVGELRDGDGPKVLLRAPGLEAGVELMVTHLPNAIDGLAVQAAN